MSLMNGECVTLVILNDSLLDLLDLKYVKYDVEYVNKPMLYRVFIWI